MSKLADLQREIEQAGMAISRAERSLAAHPQIPSTAATLRSFQLMRERLEVAFLAETNALEMDCFSYRFEFDDRRRATIAALTSALGIFQKTFTSVYDALVNGPKKRASINPESVDLTAFGYSYSFPGSIGFMMTLPNERLLFGASKIDDAMEATFMLLNARNSTEIEEITEMVGLPAVRYAHQWATESGKAGLGADMIWQRQERTKSELRIQPQEIRELAYILASAFSKEEILIVADLLLVDLSEKTFQMRSLIGEIINGTFTKAISESSPAQLPKRYIATLNISTKIALVDGKEQITYFLVRLDDPGDTLVGRLTAGPPPSL